MNLRECDIVILVMLLDLIPFRSPATCHAIKAKSATDPRRTTNSQQSNTEEIQTCLFWNVFGQGQYPWSKSGRVSNILSFKFLEPLAKLAINRATVFIFWQRLADISLSCNYLRFKFMFSTLQCLQEKRGYDKRRTETSFLNHHIATSARKECTADEDTSYTHPCKTIQQSHGWLCFATSSRVNGVPLTYLTCFKKLPDASCENKHAYYALGDNWRVVSLFR